ncbi:class I SAM-dependent methyltransferase [Algoriphagus terrigena]|uniref:methyltransferase domain-containing protein n=1 Tax=Algoriphagus terrigena TaxID=344884 RepID=UPI00047AAA30|nr:class I SAM-dependent methyltransferase [Algoriphagus terrigena]
MNLQIIKDNLLTASSPKESIDFIQFNRKKIEGYFVSLTDEQIEEDKFDLQSTCLGFINSPAFQENKTNPDFIEIITLFSELFEKIGFYGAISFIQTNLPKDSSIRHRLNAVFLYSKIGNISEYFEKFDDIFQSLEKAQNYSDADYTGQVVQDTINYYLLGKNALENAQKSELLENFKALFNSSKSRQKYKFLNHPTFKEYLDGYITEKIFIELIADKVYSPSVTTQRIFQDLIIDHINTAGYLERYNNDEIRADILNYGRADFTTPYKELSPYDRVQLYCYFNMRKHFFTSYAIYEKIFSTLNSSVFTKNRKLVLIDFGCGSLTSGLALASLFYDYEDEPITMRYIGIDIADSMLEKAKEFAQTELFSPNTKFDFYSSWNLIPESIVAEAIKSDCVVIFNASYLFASSSLEIESLALFVNKITLRLESKSHFVFQNPDRADRNEKYKRFKKNVAHKIEASGTQRIYYKNNSNSTFEPSSEVVNYEILSL